MKKDPFTVKTRKEVDSQSIPEIPQSNRKIHLFIRCRLDQKASIGYRPPMVVEFLLLRSIGCGRWVWYANFPTVCCAGRSWWMYSWCTELVFGTVLLPRLRAHLVTYLVDGLILYNCRGLNLANSTWSVAHPWVLGAPWRMNRKKWDTQRRYLQLLPIFVPSSTSTVRKWSQLYNARNFATDYW